MSRLYKNAPLAEAVCEVRFDVQSAWDLTIPGLLYEKLKSELPKRTPLRFFEIETLPGSEGVLQKGIQSEILQFSNNDDTRLVRVGANSLSVHNLGFYPGWRNFSPFVEHAIRTYCEVANTVIFERIGLRFINKIRILGDEIDLADFFTFFPNLDEPLPQKYTGYVVGVEFPFTDPEANLRLQLASETSDNSKSFACRFDLDYFNTQPKSVKVEDLQIWLRKSHDRLEEIFEAAIKDRLRKLFDEEQHA